MIQQNRQDPDIVTHTIPHIEVYQVTDDELKRIEEGSGQVAQDFTFMSNSFSLFVAVLIALATGTFSENIQMTFIAAAGLFAICAIYTGIKWVRHRNAAPDVIGSIRSRRVDPET